MRKQISKEQIRNREKSKVVRKEEREEARREQENRKKDGRK